MTENSQNWLARQVPLKMHTRQQKGNGVALQTMESDAVKRCSIQANEAAYSSS